MQGWKNFGKTTAYLVADMAKIDNSYYPEKLNLLTNGGAHEGDEKLELVQEVTNDMEDRVNEMIKLFTEMLQ
ncbi:hypothetical protein Syun_011727 [Stephania yunnanensis]|uniref:Uncharacterized protein n=1 Tax=Stephania yunnanensis TaxID=152371 RepID=A0AAP0PFQ7_9MAGN